LPVADNLLSWASRDNLYSTDPFITLYTIGLNKVKNQASFNWKQLEACLDNNPDFVPLLKIAYNHYMASGQQEKALKTAVHILEIYPAYNEWQPLGKAIETLTNNSNILGDSGEQTSS
jgi:hypothetical protein